MDNLSAKELKTIRYIRNMMMQSGRTPSTRELMTYFGYRSPRSSAGIINGLIDKGYLRRKSDGSLQIIKNVEETESRTQTVDVPLVGSAACGAPIIAEENIEAMIPVSLKLARPPYKYFLLQVKGDSMDKKNINDGDTVLVRRQSSAKNGDIVVALIDDEATIKEFQSSGDTIILKPHSSNSAHNPIILTKDFKIQGVVIRSIPKF
ncbi:MAG: transcriptional repressor LexA [Armatimonadota bacterium]